MSSWKKRLIAFIIQEAENFIHDLLDSISKENRSES